MFKYLSNQILEHYKAYGTCHIIPPPRAGCLEGFGFPHSRPWIPPTLKGTRRRNDSEIIIATQSLRGMTERVILRVLGMNGQVLTIRANGFHDEGPSRRMIAHRYRAL